MKELLIIGARGFGREVFSFAKHTIGYGEQFIIKGFLDDDSTALNNFSNYPQIISSVEEYEIQPNDVFICALGSVQWKKHYAELISRKGGEFINLISKNVMINENSKIGLGCILLGSITISNDVIVEDFVTVHSYVTFGHDVKIGKYVNIGAYCFFGGFSIIEDEVAVHVRATVLDRLRIGKKATVGAGSVVIRNVKGSTTVFGNPAKKIEF
jgi:sugar O-acyltransferase (sialic acid O-acetyltransferase NeuD family)